MQCFFFVPTYILLLPPFISTKSFMKKILLLFLVLFSTGAVFSQNDSLILKNGDAIIGELKDLTRGVATFETDYSDSDFKIEWDGIRRIYTVQTFLISTTNGYRYNGRLQSSSDENVMILQLDGSSMEIPMMDIVYLNAVDEGFWNKIDAFIDVGFDLTKANNIMTVSTRSGISYTDRRWSLGFNYNTNFTRQDEIDDIERTDGGLTYTYFLPKDFYVPVSVTYLKSSEQNLQARWNLLAGAGYFVYNTNRWYWGFSAGAAYNNENYMPDSIPDKQSAEGYFGTELNMFDIGDLNLSTKLRAFPSFTEKGRWRMDFNFDTKYDLPLEFYIKIGFSLNYDNQPVEGGSDLDYTLHTGVGWSWP